MGNDIDIIVGVKDLATAVLDRLSTKVTSVASTSKLAFAGAADRLQEQLAKASSGAGNNDKLAKAIDSAISVASSKIDAAVNKTNTAIDTVTDRIQSAISSVSSFVTKAARVATVGAAFFTVGRAIYGVSNSLGLVPNRLNQITERAERTGRGVFGVVAQFSKYTIAAGATVALTNATLRAASATTGLLGKVGAIGQGALAAFVLRNALKKTEDGASTLTAKLAKIAGTGLAFAVVTKTVVGFGLSLIGLRKNADDANASLLKTATTTKALGAVKAGASAATVATANLASKIEDLPKGAESVNTVVSGFGRFAAQIGGIPGLLLSIPAGIAGIALAAVTAAGKTERQVTLLTNKLAIVEAAKLNVSLEEIDTAPLRKVAEDTAKVAKQIQTATNVQSSKLVSLATNSLPKGLDSTQIASALKASVGLAEVYGTSIEDGMYRVRQAIEGNFESFEKLIPSISTMATDEEKLAAVSKLAANGFKVAQQETLTFWGTIEKVKNGLGNTLEAIGRMESGTDILGTVLRDVVSPVVDALDSKLQRFGFSGKDAIDVITAGFAGLLAAAETLSSNFGMVIERMLASVELFGESTKQSIYYAFDVVVNSYIPWLGKSIVTGFTEAARMAGLIFQNMATRAIDSVSAVSTFVASGGAGGVNKLLEDLANINSAPLAGDFTLKLEELPQIADRALSTTEQILADRIKEMDAKLGSDFSKSFTKAYNEMGGMLKEQGLVANIDLKPKVPEAAAASSAIEKKAKATTNETNAVLQSRFLARGASNDPQREMAQTLKRQEALLQRQLAFLEKNPRIQPAKLEVELVT